MAEEFDIDIATVAQRIKNTQEQFVKVDNQATEWRLSPLAARREKYEQNRRWFGTQHVYESSVFLYFDLAASVEAVGRALQVHDACYGVLGKDQFNPAPADRLHATVLTDIVAPDRCVSDDEVGITSAKYEELIDSLVPCVVFVMGPRLTAGGVILECRIHDPVVYEMREKALAAGAARGGQAPRVPSIEYATLGYITGGSDHELQRLHETLQDMRVDMSPVAVPVGALSVTKTVNKRIVQPTVTYPLAQRRMMSGSVQAVRSDLELIPEAWEREMVRKTIEDFR